MDGWMDEWIRTYHSLPRAACLHLFFFLVFFSFSLLSLLLSLIGHLPCLVSYIITAWGPRDLTRTDESYIVMLTRLGLAGHGLSARGCKASQ